MNNFSIEGQVAVITGGTGVLGGSISKSLLEAGVRVAVLGRQEDKLKKFVADFGGNESLIGYPCDVLNEERIREVRDLIVDKWGRIDILINVAGGNIPGATLTEAQTIFDMKIDDYKKVTELNLDGTIVPSLIFGETIAKSGKGSIINISSMATYSAITRVMGYSVAKTGINIFTQWMAMEMAMKFGDKVRVNAVAPGFFIGDQNRAVLINPDGSYTERSKKVLAKTPMGRFGDISELNGLVQFLCSDAASFITGAIIPVDGGFSSFSGV
ncbi:SDR family oxidoreductase [Mangrovibacterium diazotrophicum]|uniref:NAD(P)-dependent dehydrogenase (Short-subunit alcohol dehydrogenase family) n=1 Tax=Mangrovibacterium diazotrophicum TaxID=1261403 RepID=A0A419W7W6_9BACT|nr:SDR family oxidoreductase [Mangrovibacterium diazotrophicum]RKD91548.1 NAD(P)-dependent dehydrogenase (short-subunit alcohol dehydrogenase family) [Mangrovibacterium diazotrophicum]